MDHLFRHLNQAAQADTRNSPLLAGSQTSDRTAVVCCNYRDNYYGDQVCVLKTTL
ncbi:hypothetical protein [Marinobacterium litorale]|uniref:hypothetical protein n=1 Tax=Marinobacterium litorale TaxID=404770 RepID=UPI0003FCA247|nr:hypothetical protein [Marinobacterium litorale]